MNFKPNIVLLLTTMLFTQQLVSTVHAEIVEHTLWSDDQSCFKDGAVLLGIESQEEFYKIALCSIAGCRIAIKEFGKKSHPGNFKEDSRFEWISENAFEAIINGKKGRFYLCHTKSKQKD